MSSFKLSEKGRSIIAKMAIHNKSKPYCSMLQVPCVAYGLGKESDLVQYIGNDSRTLVLLGTANNLLSERRRANILHAADSKLTKYAKGEFPKAGKSLFGKSFVKELVSQVEQTLQFARLQRFIKRKTPHLRNRCFFFEGGLASPSKAPA